MLVHWFCILGNAYWKQWVSSSFRFWAKLFFGTALGRYFSRCSDSILLEQYWYAYQKKQVKRNAFISTLIYIYIWVFSFQTRNNNRISSVNFMCTPLIYAFKKIKDSPPKLWIVFLKLQTKCQLLVVSNAQRTHSSWINLHDSILWNVFALSYILKSTVITRVVTCIYFVRMRLFLLPLVTIDIFTQKFELIS